MQMTTSDFDLARLLAPLKPAAFTRECWEKSPRAVFRRCAGYFSGLLSLSDLDSIVCLSGSVSSENDMRLAKTEKGKFESRPVPRGADGRPDIYALYRAHRDGYTLIVNRIDSRWRPVAALCRALEYELHHKASANPLLHARRSSRFYAALRHARRIHSATRGLQNLASLRHRGASAGR